MNQQKFETNNPPQTFTVRLTQENRTIVRFSRKIRNRKPRNGKKKNETLPKEAP